MLASMSISDPTDDWTRSYGRWALVAGASEGLGAAFARSLAARGMSLLLLARRPERLADTDEQLRTSHDVEVRTHAFDLANPGLANLILELAERHEIGVGIYNAAYSPIGDLVTRELDDLMRIVDVNVRGPLIFARTLAPPMMERGAGGLVLMSSLVGLSGSPRIATYAATKAFNVVLAEGLWAELRRAGVDITASCPGGIRTPGYQRAAAGVREAPGTLDAAVVAERTLRGLRRGPRVVPGVVNTLASLVVGRWLPRRAAVSIMESNVRDLV